LRFAQYHDVNEVERLLDMLDIILTIENEEERRTAEYIWEQYRAHIHVIASRILNNPCDADDATMDTIRCVVQSIHKFVGLSDLDIVCLVTVYAKNASFKIYNKNKANAENVIDTEYQDEEDSSKDVEKLVIAKSEYEKVAQCLEALPEIYSHTFLLRHYYGWSIREIMSYLDLTEANVKKRLNRAKQMLKVKMENPNE
jgi:RNA polymerase sigma-70 factor (ECF subfamily)